MFWMEICTAGRWPGAAAAMFLLLLLPAAPANAACDGNKRVDHRNAECLDAWWDNRGVLRKNRYRVQNMCADYGKVVAKVDLKSARDRTLHLTNGNRRYGRTLHAIRGVSCCADLGNLCNRSDVVTDDTCRRRFLASPAASYCIPRSITAKASISGDNYRCMLSARCLKQPGGENRPYYVPSMITVQWLDAPKVKNCNGWLTLGDCTRGRSAGSALTVEDAAAREVPGATLGFAVIRGAPASDTVSVDYATADGTARAGSDYRAARGTLTFAPGETSKTVPVDVHDDAIDEGSERFFLRLTNARGARIADGEAVGTISNRDPVQKKWLARFGRTVAEQTVDAVTDRLLSGPARGARRIVPSGRTASRDNSGRTDAGAGNPTDIPLPAARLRPGSAFHLSGAADAADGPDWAAWGRIAAAGFEGADAAGSNRLAMDGQVTTGIAGFDLSGDRWLAGIALSASESAGSYRLSGVDRGRIAGSLTALYPYVRFDVNDRVQAWGLAGYGFGDLRISRQDRAAPAVRTDIDMRLFAAGLRGALLDAGDSGGFELAVRADAFLASIEADRAPGTAATEAEASRFRLLLEGSRAYALGKGGQTLTPGLEIGLRHDGGDAETGLGIEAGGRLLYSDPASRLTLGMQGRMLLAHEEKRFGAWIASFSVRLEPRSSGRGLSLSMIPSFGAAPYRPAGPTPLPDVAGGLPASGGYLGGLRLDVEAGYGLGIPADRGPITPFAGVSVAGGYRTWRTGARWQLRPEAVLDLEILRREIAGEPALHGIALRAEARW